MHSSFLSFFVLCFLLTITPGADTALVLKSSMKRGRFFIATIFGICSGLLFHATMSSLGLSAILQKSAELYSIVKLVGACYLMYLGARALYEAWFLKRESVQENLETASAKLSKISAFSEFRIGLLTNILNPKVAVFYLTFLPQFIDPSGSVIFQSLLLSLVHIALSLVWLLMIGFFVSYFKTHLEKAAVRRGVETVTGVALLGFGLRLAASKD